MTQDQALLDIIAAMQAGRAAHPKPVNMAGYDTLRMESLRKTYAHEPTTGDPTVTYGADPLRVREMTDPREKEGNWGSYYHDEDLIYLNPDIPQRDFTDTAKHEFRHRGVKMLDEQAGQPQDFNLEELAMLMTDMGNGIGPDSYNIPAIMHMAARLAKERGVAPMDVMREADGSAAAYNSRAVQALGGGAGYVSPMETLIYAMTRQGPMQ